MKPSPRRVRRTRRQRRHFLGESEMFSGLRAGSAELSACDFCSAQRADAAESRSAQTADDAATSSKGRKIKGRITFCQCSRAANPPAASFTPEPLHRGRRTASDRPEGAGEPPLFSQRLASSSPPTGLVLIKSPLARV